jgi:hypothetical protein
MMRAVSTERLDATRDVLRLADRDVAALEAAEGGQTIGKALLDVR